MVRGIVELGQRRMIYYDIKMDDNNFQHCSTDKSGRKLFWAKLKGYMYGEEIRCGWCGKGNSSQGGEYSRVGPTPNDIL